MSGPVPGRSGTLRLMMHLNAAFRIFGTVELTELEAAAGTPDDPVLGKMPGSGIPQLLRTFA